MAGLDKSFDAAMFVGYHASTTNPKGVRAHTFSSAKFTRVALNGKPVTEGAFNAAVAGHFGVPVIMVAGDNAACAEVQAQVGKMEAVETKRALSFESADTLTPAASCELICFKARTALNRRKDFAPFRVPSPVSLEISFKHYKPVEGLAYLKGIERIDSHSIRYRGADMLEISNFLNFIEHYDPNLEP